MRVVALIAFATLAILSLITTYVSAPFAIAYHGPPPDSEVTARSAQRPRPFLDFAGFPKTRIQRVLCCQCFQPPRSLYAYAPLFPLKLLPYVDLGVTSVGISSEFSFYLVPIANGSSSLGRIVSGLTGDDLTFLCAIKTHMWPFAMIKASRIAIAIVYDFCSGAISPQFWHRLWPWAGCTMRGGE